MRRNTMANLSITLAFAGESVGLLQSSNEPDLVVSVVTLVDLSRLEAPHTMMAVRIRRSFEPGLYCNWTWLIVSNKSEAGKYMFCEFASTAGRG